jgi:hypothetical protein
VAAATAESLQGQSEFEIDMAEAVLAINPFLTFLNQDLKEKRKGEGTILSFL